MSKKTLELTEEEIIVLHNYLAPRVDRMDKYLGKNHKLFDMNDPDFSERVVLNDINNALESLDPIVFSANYDELLQRAKKVITEGSNPETYGLSRS